MIAQVLIATALLIAAVMYWLHPSRRTRKLINAIPGPTPMPLVGNALSFGRGSADTLGKLEEIIRTHAGKEGLVRLWIGSKPILIAVRSDTVEPLLKSTKHLSKLHLYEMLQPWLSTGLFTSNGEKWRQRRKVLTPAFHFKILSDLFQVHMEQADLLVNNLQGMVGEKEFDIMPHVSRMSLNIIYETVMGKRIEGQDKAAADYARALDRISELVFDRTISPWKWPELLFKLTATGREQKKLLKVINDFVNEAIKQRMEENDATETQGERRLALLDVLLKTTNVGGERLSLEDIREEVNTFMFTGHDTTAAGVSWTMFMIGAHPEIQAKLQQEVDTVFGDKDHMTIEDARELKYLERTIKESLRIAPPRPLFGRVAEEEFKIGKYTVPKGTEMAVSTFFLHRNPKVFPNPEKFDPDRFLPENINARDPFSYIPFSAGMRNCIGQKFAMMEEKVAIASLLRHFTIKSTQSWEELRSTMNVNMQPPSDGIKVRLERRV